MWYKFIYFDLALIFLRFRFNLEEKKMQIKNSDSQLDSAEAYR